MTDISKFLKKHSSTFLCIAAVGGVVATAVMAAKATPKAAELLEQKKASKEDDLTTVEKVVAVAPAYIPAVVSGILTTVCIFSANALNHRQQVAITSAYALLSSNYKRYSDKLKELYGKETHENILKNISVEKADDISLTAPCYNYNCSLGTDSVSEEKHLFYDAYSQRYFESTLNQVIQAEYHLNRNYALGGEVSLNNLYRFLGVEEIDGGDSIGWEISYGYMWIDFDNIPSELEDGTPYYIIDYPLMPDEIVDI